ncbi:MAG: hypothetical protein H7A35_12965 [Planctomycetales bacterium]|nr:hypothetical protein [bacterium]UNM07757.1 MAG: hypothetical protein H7A35_12965 [Planctomycetales bacterium]
MRLPSICLLSSLLLLLPLYGSAQDDAGQAEVIDQGTVELLSDSPQPGELVRIRLRNSALDYVLDNPSAWSVKASGITVPSIMQIADGGLPQAESELQVIDPGQPQTKDRVVLIDRGESPRENDFLELSFSATSVLTSVLPEAGPTRSDFSQKGKEQLVFQEVTADGVLRISDIDFKPLELNRYIRLTIRNGADCAISEVKVGNRTEMPELHEVPVAIGSMRTIPAGGGSVWPLVLSTNRMPLRKLKIVTDNPGMYRRLRFVRMDDQQHELYKEAEIVYADSLKANGITRTNNYVELSGGMGGQQPALIVEDGSGVVLPLKSVQAYAAEVYICFAWPDSGNPVLSPLSPESAPEEDLVSGSQLVGTFSTISAAAAVRPSDANEEDGASTKSGEDKGFLGELDLQKYLPKFEIGYKILLPLALLLAIAGLAALISARSRDFRG